jgi:hypothetical protein
MRFVFISLFSALAFNCSDPVNNADGDSSSSSSSSGTGEYCNDLMPNYPYPASDDSIGVLNVSYPISDDGWISSYQNWYTSGIIKGSAVCSFTLSHSNSEDKLLVALPIDYCKNGEYAFPESLNSQLPHAFLYAYGDGVLKDFTANYGFISYNNQGVGCYTFIHLNNVILKNYSYTENASISGYITLMDAN